MRVTALKRVASVQLDVHIALAGRGNGGLARDAHVNVYILNGDVCGLVFLRIDGDGVFRRASLNDGSVVLHSGSAALGYRLAVFSGADGNVAVLQIPFRRKRGHRQVHDQQQRDDRGNQSSHFHWMYVLLPRPDPYPSGRQPGDCIGISPDAMGYPIANFRRLLGAYTNGSR